MVKYSYMMIDLGSIIIPLLFSFHPKVRLYRHWDCLIPGIVIVAAFYALWDSWFVHLGIWGFNPAYLTGLHIGNLPLEELLFFICIPYACLFTFSCLSGHFSTNLIRRITGWINYILLALLFALSLIFFAKPYTSSAFIFLGVLVVAAIVSKPLWLPKFYPVYLVLLIPFLVVNGLLTGTGLSHPVVWYSQAGIIGLRVFTIPVEDFFYGMGLILANVWIYRWLRSRQRKRNSFADRGVNI
ncbi:MAG: lycopene cyclase domain-containing protein [Mucilaginibacter sp.]|nr:lycopene cyclase domain-containing protein [Mucilaginibacter sp.]